MEELINLKQKADSLGIEYHHRIGVEKLREKIKMVEKKEQMYTVQIHKTDGDSGSIMVPISVNGKTWLIKRGEDVKVPASVVEVLKNAVKTVFIFNEKENEINSRDVPAYPFSATPA